MGSATAGIEEGEEQRASARTSLVTVVEASEAVVAVFLVTTKISIMVNSVC
jgi:hypothetical protein